MGYIEDIQKLNVIKDAIVGKDAATKQLLDTIATYGGDETLAQAVIDADAGIQALLFAAMSAAAAAFVVKPADLPSVFIKVAPIEAAPVEEIQPLDVKL